MVHPLHAIDLNLLYTFQTFVDEGGVAPAARRLGRSQPAISARLHQLQDDLGVRLFERVGRRLELTPVGRAVHDEACTVLAAAQRIVDRARSGEHTPAGRLRIGALPTVGVFVLAPVIARYVRAHDAVEIDLRYGLTPELIDELTEGSLDMVVSVGVAPQRSDLDVTPLREVTAVAIVRAGTPRLPKGPITLSWLAGMSLIVSARLGDPFFDAVSDFVGGQGMVERIRVSHIQTLKALVLEGAGVSIVPDYTVVEPELIARKIEQLDFSHPMWMAMRSSSRDVLALQELRDALCASVR
jgi:LysR family hydrogen peroxide-inducible transcriptional activator